MKKKKIVLYQWCLTGTAQILKQKKWRTNFY